MWRKLEGDAPDHCVVILSMGISPTTGDHYDVVTEARRDANGVWSGNAMENIGARIRAWAPLPSWFRTTEEPSAQPTRA